MVPQRKDSNFPATEPQNTEYYDLTDKEFKIVIMKKL